MTSIQVRAELNKAKHNYEFAVYQLKNNCNPSLVTTLQAAVNRFEQIYDEWFWKDFEILNQHQQLSFTDLIPF
ncbi:MAG TPA: hypothetical protein VK203_07335 [Nostocaceae cyanobacterium]|nr:hypothetical protein [Nostocaceae cyanobacterium]